MSKRMEQLSAFETHLQQEERAKGTIEMYLRSARMFFAFLEDRPLTKENALAWKAHLEQKGYAVATLNSKLVATNQLLEFLGAGQCRVRLVRCQRQMFREGNRELTRQEYERLVHTAEELGQERLGLLLQAICATGIRVSEVKYLTVEAAGQGRANVTLKGKIRTILIPGKLCRKLLKYARKQKIASGEIFLTRSGASLSRKQIWAEMKRLCKKADVSAVKVFPHNLRHLFATVFYKACKDIVRLADVLGHSNVETTRIYLLTTSAEHARQLERLKLIC